MVRPNPVAFFKQSLKSDSYHSDELINIFVLRPIAAVIVWFLYPTRATPSQVTIGAIVIGLAAACAYTLNSPFAIAAAGLLVTAKDIFDDADGQLARAKHLHSRRGRFLDSIGDCLVNIALFGAVTSVVYRIHPGAATIVLGILSFFGTTLRVSYHVYYQVSFLHLEDRYKLNRITEEITEEDQRGDPVAFRLQQIFLFIYGWQDRLMYRIDRWSQGERFQLKSHPDKVGTKPKTQILSELPSAWYSDRFALRLSGLLGFGTEFALLTLCSLFNELHLYLQLNVYVMNGILAASILYRRMWLADNLT